MEVDTDEEKLFQCVPCDIAAEISSKGMRIVRLNDNDTLVIWFDDHAVVINDLSDGALQYDSGAVVNKLTDVEIFDVFLLDGKVCVLDVNGDLAYLKQKKLAASGVWLKFFEKIRSGARNVQALSRGFSSLFMIGGCWYLNVYQTAENALELTQSLKLESLPVELPKCACIITTCEVTTLDPVLSSGLFPQVSFKKNDQIIFIGFTTGQVYYFPVQTSPREKTEVTLLFVSPEPVMGILLYQEPSTQKISHVLLIQQSGAVVVVSCLEKDLRYCYEYLPSHVHCISCIDDNVLWSSDGQVVWQNVVIKKNQHDLVLQSCCMPIENVNFLTSVPGQKQVFALTGNNTLFLIKFTEKTGNIIHELSNYSKRTEKIIEKAEELTKLKQAIQKEDQEIEAIGFAKRAELMLDKFKLTVKVYNAPCNVEEIQLNTPSHLLNADGHYIMDCTIVNNSGHDIFSSSWSLQVNIRIGNVSKLHVIELNRSSGKRALNFHLPLQVLNPCTKVVFECCLLAELSLEENSKTTSRWILMPIGTTIVDVSHFFMVLIPGSYSFTPKCILSTLYNMQENLQNIADAYDVGDEAQSLMDKPRTYRLNSQIVSSYVLNLADGNSHHSIWSNVTRHCLHRCERGLRSRIIKSKSLTNPRSLSDISALDIMVGGTKVKLILNSECSRLEISSCDIEILHTVKDFLISSLRLPSKDADDVATSLSVPIQEYKTAFELEQRGSPDVVTLRNKWRQITAQLPL